MLILFAFLLSISSIIYLYGGKTTTVLYMEKVRHLDELSHTHKMGCVWC